MLTTDRALGNDPQSLKTSLVSHLRYSLGKDISTANTNHWWLAACLAVRDRLLNVAGRTMTAHKAANVRRIHYLSLEYLMGRLLENNLRNTDLYVPMKEAMGEMGQDIDTILNQEPDMGLGNGGLGRLAACFLDSFSTLDLPAVGYGIHYEFGLFRQEFINGRQSEKPDAWTRDGNPWKTKRPEYRVEVKLYGHVVKKFDDMGIGRSEWVDTKPIFGIPWDIPIAGFRTQTINFLRLWEAHASDDFDFQLFNAGGYVEAIQEKARAETISRVL